MIYSMTFPNFDPVLIQFGPIMIRWYALAYITSLLLGWRIVRRLVRLDPPVATPEHVDDFLTWATIGVVLGGRLGYVLFYQPAFYLSHPLEALAVWQGGMSFHGGMLGVTIAMILFCRLRGLPLLGFSDRVSTIVPLGLGLGRVANFINGELWGRVTLTSPLGMVFCGTHIATNDDGSCVAGPLPRYPSQLFEASLEGLALFLLIRLATHRFGWFKRQGAVTGLFLLGYGLARTALENVRMPDEGLRHLPYGLTVGMMLSAPMILGGLFLLWRAFRRPADPLAAT
jgi:phosphatidylglycerol:prolipoprotein diacylglycerol transferase